MTQYQRLRRPALCVWPSGGRGLLCGVLGGVLCLGMLLAPPSPADEASAAAEIAAWAQIKLANGPEGRPLPMAGSWMDSGMFGPDRFVEMIEAGHHVLPTFSGVSLQVVRRHLQPDNWIEARVEAWRPALEYARRHRLPIAIREWNWSAMPPGYQQLLAQLAGQEIPIADDLRVIKDGKPDNTTDPFGPVAGWRAWGEMWLGNEMIRRLQEIYPDPPLVVLLNNNEGPKVRAANQLPDDYPRLLAFLGGQPPASEPEKARAIRQGYSERYAAMFAAAREALIEPAWRENVKFVAYNNLWDTAYIGQSNRPRPGIWFEPDQGWLEWRMYDGGMPELYDNDWQPGKRDNAAIHSPQSEAMNYYSTQAWLFEREPEYYWASIVWEGARVNDVFRGRRCSSKTYRYITRGQRWDFARYEGWVQFTLWTTRPRTMREFRWPPSDRHAYDEGTFMALVRSVDRPWKHPILGEFWRFGKLVPNPDEQHPWSLGDDQPDWVREFERWYLLTCDANPPRQEWNDATALRVFAQALVLGEAPQRRWLIYAHAPQGALPTPTVVLPGYAPAAGRVTLPSVPKSGAFFLLEEATGNLQTLIPGGPNELILQSDRTAALPGEAVRFTAQIAHAPEVEFSHFTWHFSDGRELRQDTLAPVDMAFATPGIHLATVTAHQADGGKLLEQVAIRVGEPPAATVKYHLPLADAFAWEGPWGDSGEPNHELLTYRHLPNAGSLPSPVLIGGRFVADEQRGRALEFDGDDNQGLWLSRHPETMMDQEGQPNQTISLWFKAADLEGRQMLYAQGYPQAGFNIYLDGDTLHAGSWATSGLGTDATGWFPVWGRSWNGHWLTSAGIEAGRWYHVALTLADATTQVQDERQILYLDGQPVASGPGVRVPRQYAPPRLGRTAILGQGAMTRFHDQDAGKPPAARPFRGRLSAFAFTLDQQDPTQ